MRRLKYFFCLAALCLTVSAARGDTTLLSVKKGGSGDQTWVVLTFDRKAAWNGVSKTGRGKYTLYFMADAGVHDGAEERAYGPSGSVSVAVSQLSSDPAIMKTEIECADRTALSVVTNANVAVIAFNNDTFLKNSMASARQDISPTPGYLTEVAESVEADRHMARLQFEGSWEWYGFSRPAPGVAAVLIHAADNQTAVQHDFNNGELGRIRIFENETGSRGLKTALFFQNDNAYSIVRKGRSMVIETAYQSVALPLLADDDLVLQEQPRSAAAAGTGAESRDVIDLSELLGKDETAVRKTTAEQPRTVRPPAAAKEPVRSERARPAAVLQEPAVPVEPDGIDWNTIVSFNFEGVPLKTALESIASGRNLNIVVDDSTSGAVTMRLKNVTLRQAMNKLVHPRGCEYYVDDGIIMVKPVRISYPGGLETKIYRLKYAEAENLLPVIRQIVVDSTRVKVYNDSFFNPKTGGAERKAYNEVTIQGVQRSSTLVVTERPIIIKEVTRVIDELDRRPVQILVHSKLVEMAPINSNKLGVDWDKTLSMAFNQVKTSGGGQSSTTSVLDINDAAAGSNTLNLGRLSAGKFQAVLDFLNEKTDTKLKSNPSLLTMDNQESSISVGTTVPVPKIQRGMGGQGDMVTFDYKEVNIQLNVTPHLTEDDLITMFVNPVIEEISGWVELDRNRAPITDKRQVNSIVTIRSGETVVIGGLVKTQMRRVTRKVWFLGSIPLIGKLFQHESMEEMQTDLMIFITPEIVDAEI